jgi:beta-phosphoglucomutase-like phosphatase (HAD superfamily)
LGTGISAGNRIKKGNAMNSIHKPEMIFIDFDGVISKNSLVDNIQNVHWFINQYTPLPLEALISFFKTTMSFPMQDTFHFLFSSLGIADKLLEFRQEKMMMKFYDNTRMKIEADFFRFIAFCEDNSFPYTVYSSRDQSVKKLSDIINRFSDNHIYDLKGRSKANYDTFLEVANELGANLKQCVYIDDTPLALRTGKLHGMTTIMMLNDIFTLADYQIFSSYIDHKINNFTELLQLFHKQ